MHDRGEDRAHADERIDASAINAGRRSARRSAASKPRPPPVVAPRNSDGAMIPPLPPLPEGQAGADDLGQAEEGEQQGARPALMCWYRNRR